MLEADEAEPDRLTEAIAMADSKRKLSLDDPANQGAKKKPDWRS